MATFPRVVRPVVTKTAKEESPEEHEAEGLPVGNLFQTEDVGHEPVPEPLDYNTKHEGKEGGEEDAADTECNEAGKPP